MLNLGTSELLVIAVVALVVLGPNRLPEAARHAGRAMAEVRRVTTGFQDEMNRAASTLQHPMEAQRPDDLKVDGRGALAPSAEQRHVRRARQLHVGDATG